VIGYKFFFVSLLSKAKRIFGIPERREGRGKGLLKRYLQILENPSFLNIIS